MRTRKDELALGKVGEFHSALEDEWQVWRLVRARVATLSELHSWDLDDLAKANALLDAQEDYEAACNEYLRKQQEDDQRKHRKGNRS